MSRYLEFLQKTFVEQGGIKERMYAARTGYRRQQNELLKRLQQENAVLKAENDRLRKELAKIARQAGPAGINEVSSTNKTSIY